MKQTKWAIGLMAMALIGMACGGGGGQVLAAAGETTSQAGTSRMAMTVSTAGLDQGEGAAAAGGEGAESLTFSTEGVIDYETGHGILTMDLASLGVPGAEGEAEMRLLGSVIYMKVPGSELGGRPWIKFDLNALGPDGESLLPLNPAGSDPRGVLDALQGVSGDVEDVGEEQIRGVSTRHYRAAVDLDKAAESVPEGRREDFAAFSEDLGIEQLPIDVWVDSDGRARRLSYEINPAEGAPFESPSGSSERVMSSANLTIDLYDFGVKVDVAAPPDSEVTDFGALDAAA